ncbi:hypothetical protein AU106_gp042 [Sinorhizobium phage phiM9]|uniref:Uncharacterized protein n=1 Tax=Sinorhizobium phage phiM9 TaxID=1636182 RepID=A0A0F6R7D4_9CAUD|nr:hypothetical protein AU106_gp042 [Sinorhizobium phage phiM9]AKE44673.1 hypothetical protein Sm_phiM9_043 [Sinorhizobium phage phiM9]
MALEMFVGKGDLRNFYLLKRGNVCAIFEDNGDRFPLRHCGNPFELQIDLMSRYFEDFSQKWEQIPIDPDLMKSFYIKVTEYMVFQKDLMELGFGLPPMRVYWKGVEE